MSTQQMSDEYQYHSLKPRDIRVIQLYPPIPGSPHIIHISLMHVFINEELRYSALSYAWGDLNRCKQVICDGKRMPVTENLFAALNGVRFRFLEDLKDDQGDNAVPLPAPFLIWADAICIDQSNQEELGAQVELMGRIYSQAYGVLAWLGEDDEGMDKALRLVDELRGVVDAVANAEKNEIPDVVKRANITPTGKAAWTAFERLFTRRAYISRTLLVQEIALAKRCVLLVGRETVPWQWLAEAVDGCHCFAEHVADPHIGFYLPHQLETVRWQMKNSNTPRPLSDVLFRFRMWKSSDPCDKVYALLGLSDSPYVNNIIPNYLVSVTEVFQRVCRVVMTNEKSLELLSAVPPHPTVAFNILSWVPDWTRFLNRLGSLGPESFDASGGRTPRITPSPNESTLILTSHKLSTLQSIGLTHPAPHGHWFETPDYACYVYRQWFVTALALRTYPTGETVVQALALTLLGGRKASTWSISQDDIDHSVQQLLKIGWILFPAVGRPHMLNDVGVNIGDFLHQMEAMTPYRRIAVTEDGYIGLVPDSAQVGDVVCLLYGGRTPYVLRNKTLEIEGQREEEEWRFVGECYVHGLMLGEAMRRPDVMVQEFVLR